MSINNGWRKEFGSELEGKLKLLVWGLVESLRKKMLIVFESREWMRKTKKKTTFLNGEKVFPPQEL